MVTPSFSRTVPQGEDLAWLPPRVRAVRWSALGAIWGGAGLATLATLATVPAALFAWKAFAVGGVGLAVASDRVGKAVVARHVAKLTRGEVALGDLRQRDEGAPVHVRGRVQLLEHTLTGVLHGTPGVARRLVFSLGGRRWIQEAACDFALVDEAGERVFVHVGGVHVLATPGELVSYPAAKLAPALPAALEGQLAGVARVPAWELVLRDGMLVDVIGVKTTTPDATGDGGNYREPPRRSTLAGGQLLPLLIAPVVAPR